MKTKLILIIFSFTSFTLCFAQQNVNWNKWSGFMGEWKGEGSGQPGKGDGTFTFAFNLDKKVIERKSHSEYPATKDKPLIIHDDLMIVYPNYTAIPSKAIYFDNEGHIINYTIAYVDNSIVLTSEKLPHVPIFRLTYTLLDNETVNTKFEMSKDGEKFMTYIEGKSKKVK
jgi:hypothetical protein